MSFITDFDPRRGDVIYGITPARTKYRDAFTLHHQAFVNAQTPDTDAHYQMLAALGWHQMDEYNNHFGIPTTTNLSSAKKVDKHLGKKSAESVATGVAKADINRVTGYASNLAASRYSPASVFGASSAKLDEEGYLPAHFTDSRGDLAKMFGVNKNLSTAAQARAQAGNYLAIRRACKFGIGLVATAPEFQDAMVHFILDGMDMSEVCEKRTRQATGAIAKNFVSITVSELRYVYRNWSKLSAKVALYVNLQPVAAPWITDWGSKAALASVGGNVVARKDLWDAYGVERATKYPGGLPDKAVI